MAISKDRSYRALSFSLPDDIKEEGLNIVEGYPVVYDSVTVLLEYGGIEYKEVIERGALDEADITDVVFVADHQGKPAARTKNKTLILERQDSGLYFYSELNKNATGRELYEDIRNKFYDKMSFSFTVEQDTYNHETNTRHIQKIKKVYDISAVTFAAYEQTLLIARSWVEAQANIKAGEPAARIAEAYGRSAEADLALELRKARLRAQILGKI